MEGMDIDDSPPGNMTEVTMNLAEKFELPDICDAKFWDTEIKFMTEEYTLHCGKLKNLVGYDKKTVYGEHLWLYASNSSACLGRMNCV